MKTKKKVVIGVVAVCALGYLAFHHTRETDTRDVITNEIVVDFKDDVSAERVAELGKKLHVSFKAESSYTSVDKLYVGEVEDGVDEDAVLDELSGLSEIEAADKDELYTIPENFMPADVEGLEAVVSNDSSSSFPNDPLYDSRQWNMKQIHLNKAWQGKAGEGIVIAIIDTGVSKLEDMNQTKFVPGYNFVANNEDASDDNSHGSHCAGTAAQSTNNGIGVAGVAYRASIMPLKVLSAGGNGSTAAITQAINFATNKKVGVISMSLGGGGSDKVMAAAIKKAHEAGVVVIAASGNSNRGVSYPAKYPFVIAVGATGTDEKRTNYSNYGEGLALVAPGGNGDKTAKNGILQNTIVKGKDDYYSYSGTSMATPAVAGAAAMIMSEGITDPDTVRDILVKTARKPKDVSTGGSYTKYYGAGILDVDAAVKMAQGKSGGLLGSSHWCWYLLGIGLVLVVWFVARRKRK